MDSQKGFVSPDRLSKEEVIENIESCVLCGSRLRFFHRTDYLTLQVQEEANCPSCGIKAKSAFFILQ